MISYSEWGIIEETKKEIIDHVKKIVKFNNNDIIPVNDWISLGFSYGGWSFSEKKIEIIELKKILMQISNNNLAKQKKNQLKDELENISKDVKQFCQNIIHVDGTGKYYQIPFLKIIDIEKFYKIISALTIQKQEMIIYSLEERYGKKYSNGKVEKNYIPDLENLSKLVDLYKANMKKILYNPKEFMVKKIIRSLDELIEYFNQSITNNF